MTVVDFDDNFVTIIASWEGSAHDNFILRKAIENSFVDLTNIVDRGYVNARQFISLYRERPYHLASFQRRPRTSN